MTVDIRVYGKIYVRRGVNVVGRNDIRDDLGIVENLLDVDSFIGVFIIEESYVRYSRVGVN